MKKDTKKSVISASEIGLSLEDLIRRGAHNLVQQAVETELEEMLLKFRVQGRMVWVKKS